MDESPKRTLGNSKLAVPSTALRTPQALVAAAGEHYVLHRLFRHGLLAALAPRNEPNFDVMVLGQNATVVATIQVKTRTRSADQGWMMRQKHESVSMDGLFYAFVDLEKPDAPVTYVMPSAVAASVVKHTHADWLATPGSKGQARNDNTMRRIRPAYPDSPKYAAGWLEKWRERWDLIENYKPAGASPGHS
jgi:hypothetical protein